MYKHVEGGIIPIRGVMACGTVCAKTAIVLIILAVAGIAILRCALVNAILMTFFTRCFDMLTFQLEGRKTMVKFGGLPSIRRVTGATVATKARFMQIVGSMAGVTILRGRLEIG